MGEGDRGPTPQPSYVPWPGIEPVIFHFARRHPTNWATPVRTHLQSFFTGYSFYYYLVSYFVHSFNKHLLSTYCESGIVLGAGNTMVGKMDICPPECTTWWAKDDHRPWHWLSNKHEELRHPKKWVLPSKSHNRRRSPPEPPPLLSHLSKSCYCSVGSVCFYFVF